MTDEARLFGKGWAFPPRVGADGRVAWSTGRDNVRENIRVILSTEARERVMLPRFGAGLQRFLYEPNNVATRHAIRERVQKTLAKSERRIKVESVEVSEEPDDARAVRVDIRYVLVATGAKERVGLTVQLEG
ncbi:MAG: GPW/gp25 family protein [Myxococcales bacterium]|nr:GPW/gp25 family protein [Myxococcales bacterium]MCB9648412.1 GPW/gp25 family protein [Deltaproteobacteria bacterium]